jgi:hypothetical protein
LKITPYRATIAAAKGRIYKKRDFLRENTAPMDELFDLTNRKDIYESGGGHNQKGVEFQRHWAVMQMFELERSGAKDFLFLFETIQDVVVLDSENSPTSVRFYQLKKKDRKEWQWAELTELHQPQAPGKSAKQKTTQTKQKSAGVKQKQSGKDLSDIRKSPLGKLCVAVFAIEGLQSAGYFVSNAGCDLPLVDGTSAATAAGSCAISTLSPEYVDLLSEALKSIRPPGAVAPDLSRVHIERVRMLPDDPGQQLVGRVLDFLLERSPRHAGQARALVDALLAKIGPLGARTDHCKTMDQLRAQRGYSRAEFSRALGDLESTPDRADILNDWLNKLTSEGLGYLEVTAVRSAATAIFRRQVMGARSADEVSLIAACDTWLAEHPDQSELLPYFEAAYADLQSARTSFRRAEFFAQFALRAIEKCVART